MSLSATSLPASILSGWMASLTGLVASLPLVRRIAEHAYKVGAGASFDNFAALGQKTPPKLWDFGGVHYYWKYPSGRNIRGLEDRGWSSR